MHSKLCWLTFLTFAVAIDATTAQGDQTQRFSGTWRATVKDSVVCTIHLRVRDEISGSLEDCRIQTDADGNLIESEPSAPPPKPSPISNARITGTVLSFDDRDEGETISFEMTVVGEAMADLVVKNAPVKIKPIRFVRASSAK